MGFKDIVVELVVGYIALLIMTRVLGKTTITQISTFDFIAVLILGELVGAAMYSEGTKWTHVLFAMFVWGILIYSTARITQKFRKSREIFEGNPSIIINKGAIDFKTMKKNQLDLDQLMMLLRVKDVFSIVEVDYAIIEANGDISILKKMRYAPVTNNDMNIAPKMQYLSYMLVQDGEVIDENLTTTGKTPEWLEQQITIKGFATTKDVFLAEYNEEYGLYVQGYD